jgi:hypothetical protein
MCHITPERLGAKITTASSLLPSMIASRWGTGSEAGCTTPYVAQNDALDMLLVASVEHRHALDKLGLQAMMSKERPSNIQVHESDCE